MNKHTLRDIDWYRIRLAPPRGAVRVVVDTDAANEIDDQFALAWILLSQDRLQLEGVYAAPFSFEHRRQEMLRASALRAAPGAISDSELALVERYSAQLTYFEQKGWSIGTVDWPVFDPPSVGMERSYQEIRVVFDKLAQSSQGKVFRGATSYLKGMDSPASCEAVEHLVHCARATPAGDTLYVVALGCVTNIASALLAAPDIIDKIVVVWTSGYPSHAPHVNNAFNLEQDILATNVLLSSGVPLVYLPGFHVGAQLRLSLPEMEQYVKGRGAIGDYLHHLFTHNPLWDFCAIDCLNGHSWVIWDIINVAWLLNPDWVPSGIVSTPTLDSERRWQPALRSHPMREAHGVARDAIFKDFFAKLDSVRHG